MPVGQQATVQGINNSLTDYALQMRNLMQAISNLNMQIGQLGTQGLMNVGMGSADAAATVSMAAILNTPAAVYFGQATQATTYDFNNALCPLWAGQ